MTRQTLPSSEAKILVKLREADLPSLRERVVQLRDAKWTLAAIGEPLQTGRSTARLWEMVGKEQREGDSKPGHPLLSTPVPAPPRNEVGKVIRLLPDVPPEKRAELRELAADARRVRGWTPDTHPTAQASRKLDTLLEGYVETGVPVKRLAKYMGVTYRAVAARLERRAERELQSA